MGTTYAVLSLIPISMSAYAFYCWCRGDKDGTRGGLFFAFQGYLCLPMSVPFCFAVPWVYLTDWTQRRLLDKFMHVWGRVTCLPFFKPETFVEKLGEHEQQEESYQPVSLRSALDSSNLLREHLDSLPPELREKGVLYVCNHQSWVDIYALMWLGIPLKFLSKPEILLIPVCGWAMTSIGCIPVYRDRPGDIIQRCSQRVHEGSSIFFFAEGTRSKDGSVGPFKAGAFKIAFEEQAAIVPLTVCGTGDMMPPNSFALSTKSCKVYAHQPILPTHPDGTKRTVDELMKATHAAVRAPLEWQRQLTPPS